MPKRCAWVSDDPLYIAYHDNEWGQPSFNNQHLFEMLLLEGLQAGLNWLTVLKKRADYRDVFDNFNPETLACITPEQKQQYLLDPRLIRNRLKMNALVQNARAYLRLSERHGDFSDFVWQFVDGTPQINHWQQANDVPVMTPESKALSHALKKAGFSFVGPTICYAYMQAIGMVNDHTADCFLAHHATEA